MLRSDRQQMGNTVRFIMEHPSSIPIFPRKARIRAVDAAIRQSALKNDVLPPGTVQKRGRDRIVIDGKDPDGIDTAAEGPRHRGFVQVAIPLRILIDTLCNHDVDEAQFQHPPGDPHAPPGVDGFIESGTSGHLVQPQEGEKPLLIPYQKDQAA